MKQPKYNIGDMVFHALPESPQGIVIDGRYSLLTGIWEYQVAFDYLVASLWYIEVELSTTKKYK